MVSKQCMSTQELEHVFCLFGMCMHACVCMRMCLHVCYSSELFTLLYWDRVSCWTWGSWVQSRLLASLSQIPPALELWVCATTPGLLFYLIISLWWHLLNICLHFENFICVQWNLCSISYFSSTLFPPCLLFIPAPSVFYAPVPSQISLSQLPWACFVSWHKFISCQRI